MAAVLETRTDAESRERLEWLGMLPGIALVQVAYVDRSDIESTTGGQAGQRQEGTVHDR